MYSWEYIPFLYSNPSEKSTEDISQLGDLSGEILLLQSWNNLILYSLDRESSKLRLKYILPKYNLIVHAGLILSDEKILLLLSDKAQLIRELYLLDFSGKKNLRLEYLPDLNRSKVIDLARFRDKIALLTQREGSYYLDIYKFLNSTKASEPFSLLQRKILEVPPKLAVPRAISDLASVSWTGSEAVAFVLWGKSNSGEDLTYLFVDDGKRFLPVCSINRRGDELLFPAISPDGTEVAYLVKWRKGFNLEIARMSPDKLSNLLRNHGEELNCPLKRERLTKLPPNRMVWMKPFFLNNDFMIVSSDYRGGFRTFLVDLKNNTWYPLNLPQSFLIWILDQRLTIRAKTSIKGG